jgi:hypothetical protein
MVFWTMTPYSLVDGYQHPRGTRCYSIQGAEFGVIRLILNVGNQLLVEELPFLVITPIY